MLLKRCVCVRATSDINHQLFPSAIYGYLTGSRHCVVPSDARLALMLFFQLSASVRLFETTRKRAELNKHGLKRKMFALVDRAATLFLYFCRRRASDTFTWFRSRVGIRALSLHRRGSQPDTIRWTPAPLPVNLEACSRMTIVGERAQEEQRPRASHISRALALSLSALAHNRYSIGRK